MKDIEEALKRIVELLEEIQDNTEKLLEVGCRVAQGEGEE